MPGSVQAHRTNEMVPNRTDNDGLWSTPKQLTNRLRRGSDVVRGRRGERKRRVQQRFAPEVCVGLSVVVS